MATFSVFPTYLCQVKERNGKKPHLKLPWRISSREREQFVFQSKSILRLSTKNTNCDSFPELELAHQKQEWCHKFIAKSTCRDWASDFKSFFCQPAPKPCQSCIYDMVQMRTPKTVLFFVRCMEKAEGFMFISTECRAVYHPLTSATSCSVLDCTGW